MTTPPALAEVVDKALEATIVLSFSRIGYEARRRLFGWSDLSGDRLDGRTIVVTGATSGLGLATATRLAELGASVCLLGRDPERTGAACERVARQTGNEHLTCAVADLSDLNAAADFAAEFVARHDRLDALVHNAGALTREFTLTDEGNEVTFATHVLAPFLLTTRLLPLLEATAGSRVVTVSSGGMYTEKLEPATLEMGAGDYDGVKAYARAKRAQVVLNGEWARRVGNRGVTFHAMHPGWADTPGVATSLPAFHRVMGPWLRSPAQGADTIVWLVTDPEPLRSNGDLWLDRHRRWTVKLPWTASGAEDADRLWELVAARSGAAGSNHRVGPQQEGSG